MDRDYILKIFDEFIYQTHDKALSKDARDLLLSEELKKPVCDRPLNQKGAQILNNKGFLLERAEKMQAVTDLLVEKELRREAKELGISNNSSTKVFMSIVPMAFGFIVCPIKRASQLLARTTGKRREFLFLVNSMRFNGKRTLCLKTHL